MKEVDEGIIIARSNYSDTSLILTIYLKEHGTKKFIFKGGKKKASAVFPICPVEINYYRRPESDLLSLTSLNSLPNAGEIPFNPYRSVIAYFMADVLRCCLKQEQKDLSTYNYLKDKIRQLNESNNLSLFPVQFLAELTFHLGIDPQLEENANCLDIEEGVFSKSSSNGLLVEKGEVVDLLYSLFSGQTELEVTNMQRKEMLRVLLRYYKYHIPGFDVSRTLDVLTDTLH